MAGAPYVALLDWALPRLGLRTAGFRNVGGQVVKRIKRRVAELGLEGAPAYRARLERDPAEWTLLERLCFVTISRFYRDAAMWDALRAEVLPALAEARMAAKDTELRAWSLGCASGEEPYTLAIAWALDLAPRYPSLRLRVLGTDLDDRVLARARKATYGSASTVELPPAWRARAFRPRGEELQLEPAFRDTVELRAQDVRTALPEGEPHLILCRNMIFTYFDEALQRLSLARLLPRLVDGGAFVIGRGERLPSETTELEPWLPELGIYRRGCATR